MRIGIIGAGKVGGTLARLFDWAGHEVILSNRRGPQSLESLIADIDGKARAASPEEATACSDLVFLAVPWKERFQLPHSSHFVGKTVVDAMNPSPNWGQVDDPRGQPSTVLVQEQLRPASIVKAFNAIYHRDLAEHWDKNSEEAYRQVIFFSGDDQKSKAIVSSLITEIGFAPGDLGSLRDSKALQQPGKKFFNRILSFGEFSILRSASYKRAEPCFVSGKFGLA